MIYSSEDGIKAPSSSRCDSVLSVLRASSSAVGGGNQVETSRWVRERARGARVKRREDRLEVVSSDILSVGREYWRMATRVHRQKKKENIDTPPAKKKW